MVEAKWSGHYPCLCAGKWTLIVSGIDVSDKIPDKLRVDCMNTYGTYQEWRYEDGDMVFVSYNDGLEEKEWIEVNNYWLNNITKDYSVKKSIFKNIQAHDFRGNSCGGCF